jgi:hypothetical protein
MIGPLIATMEQKSRKIAHKADLHDTSDLGHSAEFWMINIQPKRISDVPIHSCVVKGVHDSTYKEEELTDEIQLAENEIVKGSNKRRKKKTRRTTSIVDVLLLQEAGAKHTTA